MPKPSPPTPRCGRPRRRSRSSAAWATAPSTRSRSCSAMRRCCRSMRAPARSSATSWCANLPADALPLAGIRVLSLATSLPGPLAVARLRTLGATVAKIEPPAGDLLAAALPAWYTDLHQGVDVRRLDLKTPAGQAALTDALAASDLLLTAQRPTALARLGLDWETLHARYPTLCQVAIVGDPPPAAERPGHDLTYQAGLGLLKPLDLPRVLVADFAGAERAVSAGLALLLARERGQGCGRTWVALSEAAADFAAPLR